MKERYELFVRDSVDRPFGTWHFYSSLRWALLEARYLGRAFCIERRSDHVRLVQSVGFEAWRRGHHA